MTDVKRSLDREALQHLLGWVQDGVVSRRQILELHGTDRDIARLLRRRELVAIHPGVYVDHTGTPSRRQQEWAAVLFYWPAALTRESALPKPSRSGPIHVAVAHESHGPLGPWNPHPPHVRLRRTSPVAEEPTSAGLRTRGHRCRG